MDKYTKNILDLLKEKFIEVVGEVPFQNKSEARAYYVQNLKDNLYKPMNEQALASYGQGSGNEILSGKMNSLRSSSAMTYNLLSSPSISIIDNKYRIGAGTYMVEYEKQFHTLKSSVSGMPANLDAYLFCQERGEAIACEMKMTEWIFNKPGTLKAKYLDVNNYIDSESGKVFTEIAKALILPNDYDDPDEVLPESPCRMTRYDAFQMFKHAVACYTACVLESPYKINKLTLLNCAWTICNPNKLEDKHCIRYAKEEACELAEFAQFKQIMEPVKSIFANNGIEFDIVFCNWKDFISLMDKDADELRYLCRYEI